MSKYFIKKHWKLRFFRKISIKNCCLDRPKSFNVKEYSEKKTKNEYHLDKEKLKNIKKKDRIKNKLSVSFL